MKSKHKSVVLSSEAQKYLATIEVDTTRANAEHAIRAFAAFRASQRPRVRLRELNMDVLDNFNAWLSRHDYAKTSRRTFVAFVTEFLRYAVDQEWIPPSFSLERATYRIRKAQKRDGAKYPIPKFDPALPRVLVYYDHLPLPAGDTPAEKRERLGILRGRAVMHTLYASAGRVSEVAGLMRKDVQDGRRGEAEIVGKGDKPRVLYLTPDARSAIGAYVRARADTDEALFIQHTRKYGTPLSRFMIWKIVRRAGDACGVKNLSPHDFRHYRASQMLQLGAPIEAIQEILGHADIGTTRRVYAHYSKPKAREIFEQHTISAADAATQLEAAE